MESQEVFIVEGTMPDMPAAHNLAWAGLTQVVGPTEDPVLEVANWTLVVMRHIFVPAEFGPAGQPAVSFHAEFVRTQEGAVA